MKRVSDNLWMFISTQRSSSVTGETRPGRDTLSVPPPRLTTHPHFINWETEFEIRIQKSLVKLFVYLFVWLVILNFLYYFIYFLMGMQTHPTE